MNRKNKERKIRKILSKKVAQYYITNIGLSLMSSFQLFYIKVLYHNFRNSLFSLNFLHQHNHIKFLSSRKKLYHQILGSSILGSKLKLYTIHAHPAVVTSPTLFNFENIMNNHSISLTVDRPCMSQSQNLICS